MFKWRKKKPVALIHITEKDGVHKQWYIDAREMTMEKLPAFLEMLTTRYEHDYGTICHAVASASIAAAWAVERCPQGGITGFQAGCIMWEFITHWETRYRDVPARLVTFEDMLYPQSGYKFNTMSQSSWDWVQKKARENLDSNSEKAHPEVISHWKSIANGKVPFGYTIKD